MRNEDLFILHNQYHGSWWPGDTRSQGISSHGIDIVFLSSHGIDIVFPKYSNISTRTVKLATKVCLWKADKIRFQ